MKEKSAVLNRKKLILGGIIASLILIISVSACVFALTPSDDKKDNKETTETVVSKDDDTKDTSSEPTSSEEDKGTESEPTETEPEESKPEDTSSEQKPATSKPQDTSSEQKPVTSEPQDTTSKPQETPKQEFSEDEIGRIPDNSASLSEDTIKKIKVAFLDSRGYKNYNQETIEKMTFEYYTTLSDGSMLLFVSKEYKATDKLTNEYIDEYTFAYYGGKYPSIYKYGKLYGLQGAYRAGLISKETVKEVAQKFPQIDVSYQYP